MNQIRNVFDCSSYPAALMADEFSFRISMSALSGDGCVATPIVSQGAAGTHFSTLAFLDLHGVSVEQPLTAC